VLGDRLGGAKGGVRADAGDPAARADAMARYCAEIRPLVASRTFLTGPDLGTYEEDFAPIRDLAASPSAVTSSVDGVSFDNLVPGARTGVLDEARAARIQARAVVPAANAPYTEAGLRTLQRRGIAAHADFICNAGAVIAYRSRRDATPERVLADVDARIRSL